MTLRLLFAVFFSMSAAFAQPAPNSQPNPYRAVENFFKLPEGRTMGSTSLSTSMARATSGLRTAAGPTLCTASLRHDEVRSLGKLLAGFWPACSLFLGSR